MEKKLAGCIIYNECDLASALQEEWTSVGNQPELVSDLIFNARNRYQYAIDNLLNTDLIKVWITIKLMISMLDIDKSRLFARNMHNLMSPTVQVK